jgi:HEAT repeat protein
MIDADLIAITSGLLRHESEEVREQAALLIASFSTHNRACPHLLEYSFKNLNIILEDKSQRVRNAAAFVFHKLTITTSGC